MKCSPGCEQASGYAPIEDYGVIGDLHTVALVGKNGAIDFLCLPSFDSPSVFAALVDAERGGRFQIAPQLDDAVHRQLYLPDTNVLLSRFLSDSGVAEVSDFMPVEDAGVAHNTAFMPWAKWSGEFLDADKFIETLYNSLTGSKGEFLKHN